VASVRNKAASTISLTHRSCDRVQPFEKFMSFRFMHGSIDHSRRYRVYTNAFLRVFNGEGAGHRIQGALQHDLNGAPTPAIGWSTRVVEMLTISPILP